MQRREFLELAKELSQRASESCSRTAMSRAYFAAFHRTRDFLLSRGFHTRKNDQAHGGLYRRLSGSNSSALVEVSRFLRALRSRRNQADYDLDDVVTRKEAVEATADAESVFEILDVQFEPTELVQLTDTIRAFERDVLREVTWRTS